LPNAIAADGTEIFYETAGDPANPAVFLGPSFAPSHIAEKMGVADPTQQWIEGLADDFHVILADYPRGIGKTGNPLGLDNTIETVQSDIEAVLDAAGVDKVGWLGYSLGGVVGIQMACRTERLWALAVGGWPVLNGPYAVLRQLATEAAAALPPGLDQLDPKMLLSIAAMYSTLEDWPERTEVAGLQLPRTVFMGTEDVGLDAIEVPMAGYLREVAGDLEELGWPITWLEGLDHLGALGTEASLPLVLGFFRAAAPQLASPA
jgi:pimeloyl-ACP methyl ester carboxylesterase